MTENKCYFLSPCCLEARNVSSSPYKIRNKIKAPSPWNSNSVRVGWEQDLVNKDPIRKMKEEDIFQGHMKNNVDPGRIFQDCYARSSYKWSSKRNNKCSSKLVEDGVENVWWFFNFFIYCLRQKTSRHHHLYMKQILPS